MMPRIRCNNLKTAALDYKNEQTCKCERGYSYARLMGAQLFFSGGYGANRLATKPVLMAFKTGLHGRFDIPPLSHRAIKLVYGLRNY